MDLGTKDAVNALLHASTVNSFPNARKRFRGRSNGRDTLTCSGVIVPRDGDNVRWFLPRDLEYKCHQRSSLEGLKQHCDLCESRRRVLRQFAFKFSNGKINHEKFTSYYENAIEKWNLQDSKSQVSGESASTSTEKTGFPAYSVHNYHLQHLDNSAYSRVHQEFVGEDLAAGIMDEQPIDSAESSPTQEDEEDRGVMTDMQCSSGMIMNNEYTGNFLPDLDNTKIADENSIGSHASSILLSRTASENSNQITGEAFVAKECKDLQRQAFTSDLFYSGAAQSHQHAGHILFQSVSGLWHVSCDGEIPVLWPKEIAHL
jgi:hypothetical protein